MPTPFRTLLRTLSVASLALAAAACSFHRSVGQHTVEFNRSIESATNQILLLNVLRAMDRRPMHFSELTKITGLIRGTGSVALTSPFGGDAPNEATSMVLGQVQSGPTFDVQVLDTQDFQQGIMSPVDGPTFQYYWDQGWPKELLLYLLVREVRFDATPELRFVNYPPDHKQFGEFACLVDDILLGDPEFQETPHGGDRLQIEPPSLADVLEAREQGLTVERTDAGYVLVEEPKRLDLRWNMGSTSSEHHTPHDELCAAARRKEVVERLPKPDRDDPSSEMSVQVGDGRSQAKLLLRSPEAILYFLGELAREQLDAAASSAGEQDSARGATAPELFVMPEIRTRIRGGEANWPLFVVLEREKRLPWRRTQGMRDAIALEYDGRRYAIPAAGPAPGGGGRSLSAFTIVSQLFSLHKSREELPTTGTLTVIGVE